MGDAERIAELKAALEEAEVLGTDEGAGESYRGLSVG